MKLKIIYLLTFILGIGVSAQSAKYVNPNYSKIKQAISEENSNLFYPKLLKRYKSSDETLSLEEKIHLYYGYVFQENYGKKSPYTKDLQIAVKLKDTAQIIRLSNLILDANPFNFLVLNQQMYIYNKLGDTEKFDASITKIRVVFDAILSTGNGKKAANSFNVIDVSDEFQMITMLRYKYTGRHDRIRNLDYLWLEKNKDNIKGLYFVVSKINLDKL